MPHSMIVDPPGSGTATTPTGLTSSRETWRPMTPTCRSSWCGTSSTTASTASARPARASAYPAELVTSAPALGELAAALGIDGAQLDAPPRRSATTPRAARIPTSGAAP